METQTVTEIASLIRKPEEYGAKTIDAELLSNFEKNSKLPVSHLLKRGIFNGHIGFDAAIQHAAAGKPLYIYLPISPSDRLTTLRHVLFLKFASYLQKALNCYVFVHVNEYKAFCREPTNLKAEAGKKMAEETLKDVLSFDFVPEKTIVLLNEAAVQLDYVMLCDLQRKVTLGQFIEKFFTDDSVNVGTMDAVFQEGACAIPLYVRKIFPDTENTRCLMLLRQTQDKLYQFTCEAAKIVGQPEPYALFGGFVPAPQSGTKMPKLAKIALGASQEQGQKGKKPKNEIKDYMSIYIKNTPKEISTKINKFAFSGGKDTLAEQQEKGANLAVDIPTYYLKLFLEDDAEYERVLKFYGPGELEDPKQRIASGGIKKICGETISAVIKEIQDRRAKVTKEQIQEAYKIRSF